MSQAMEKKEAFWEEEPRLEGALPSAPWRAGETRPAWTLPAGAETVGMVWGLAAMSLGGAALIGARSAYPQLASSGALTALVCVLNWWGSSIGGALSAMSGREPGARMGAAKGAALLQAKANAFSTAAFFGAVASPLERIPGAGPRMRAFRELCRSKMQEFNLKRKLLDSNDAGSLTEIGAWRAARDLLSAGRAPEAAKVWLERPFNPEWTVRALQRAGAPKKVEISFKKALSELARVGFCSEAQSHYVEAAVGLMGAAQERLEIGESAAKSSAPSAGRGARL